MVKIIIIIMDDNSPQMYDNFKEAYFEKLSDIEDQEDANCMEYWYLHLDANFCHEIVCDEIWANIFEYAICSRTWSERYRNPSQEIFQLFSLRLVCKRFNTLLMDDKLLGRIFPRLKKQTFCASLQIMIKDQSTRLEAEKQDHQIAMFGLDTYIADLQANIDRATYKKAKHQQRLDLLCKKLQINYTELRKRDSSFVHTKQRCYEKARKTESTLEKTCKAKATKFEDVMEFSDFVLKNTSEQPEFKRKIL